MDKSARTKTNPQNHPYRGKMQGRAVPGPRLSSGNPKPSRRFVPMAERFPSGPSTRPETLVPLSLVNSTFSLDRPGAVQGAEQRSGPLTARTDPGFIQGEEKGELRAWSPQPDDCTKERFYNNLPPVGFSRA